MSIPTFIEIGVSEQTLELRSYLKELGAEISVENSNDFDTDLMHVVEASDVCWKEIATDAEVEMTLNGILSLLLMVPADQSQEPITLFCQKVAKMPKGDKRASLRLKILSNLFYGLEETNPLRADVYCSLLRVAKEADLTQMVVSDLDQIKKWIAQWDIGALKIQNTYRMLHDSLVEANMSEQATKVMIELLGTYTEENASQARDDAHRCIVTCLRDPNTFLLDHLLSLKPVKFLEGESIHDLLTIFVSGKLSEYQQFYKSNKDFIASLGLSHEENLRKMRLLTFMQLAENKKEIDYTTIQREMDIAEDQVEDFIIDVLRTKTVQAKIDQMQKKVLISSTTHRTFGRQQWQLLHQYLVKWQTNLSMVHSNLRSLEMIQHASLPQTQ
ncbi:hypothetical protein CHS0354_011554 [Potamilus streckersoni]|uniref:Eukaryotic translation initiation factor 3 subunit M n=1 Tax=Potamilus streckersoni TaxID=2493646 RepID=A0AAE0SLJ0_9BIVA|nr:hypothetical protein CHS0354_011554 [Potamilus streckersoni]